MTESRVVVVTGGGSGIGRCVAQELLKDGHQVVVAGRRREALLETLRDHPRGVAICVDVTDSASVRSLFAEVAAKLGRVDVLFNNAGSFSTGAAVDEITDDDWRQAWEVNVSGYVYCAREAIGLMKRTGRGGRVINNASVSAHVPRPHSVAYTTTKHAITGLTKSILLDGRPHSITATRLDVGNAATEMTLGMVEALQPNGSRRPEPTFDPVHIARLVAQVVELPPSVSVPELMIMATGMPFIGRG